METVNINFNNVDYSLLTSPVNKILSFGDVPNDSSWNITETLIFITQHTPFSGYDSSIEIDQRVNTSDYIIIELGNGKYYLDFSIIFRCNLVFRGNKSGNSVLFITRGMNEDRISNQHTIHAWEWDDSFITVKGQKDKELSIFMSDLTIKMESGNIFDSTTPNILTKFYHANKVVFRNIISEYENYVAHNLDLRDCSNITIENCQFKSYNNTQEGATLAIRGITENVVIRNNLFRKHGNDEIITFFGLYEPLPNQDEEGTGETEKAKPESCYKRNILIEGNEINYDYVAQTEIIDTSNRYSFVKTIDVVLSIYDLEKFTSNTYPLEQEHYDDRCEISNIVIRHNNFIANCATVGTWIGLSFSEIVSQKGIIIHDNNFIQGKSNDNSGNITAKNYRYNFTISDHSSHPSPIIISNNKLLNSDPILCSYDEGSSFESENYLLLVNGGHIEVINNKILDNALRNKYKGLSLLKMTKESYPSSPDGTLIIFKGNHVDGLATFGKLIDLRHPLVRLEVVDNYLKGDTRLYVNNVNRLNLSYIGNEFNVSNNIVLVDQLFSGHVIFRNNIVSSSIGGNIQLFNNVNYNTGLPTALPISFIEITGNQFSNYSMSLLMSDANGKVASPSLKEISGNTFI